MPTPKEVYDSTYNSTMEKGYEIAGREAAVYLPLIKGLDGRFNEAKIPSTSEEFIKFGEALVKSKMVKLGDIEMPISELQDKLAKKFPDNKNIPNVAEKVPSEESLKNVAKATAEGVSENVGEIGFLQGATVTNALKGLLNWIMNFISGLFGGESKDWGLTDFIKDASAHSMSNSVSDKLYMLRENDPYIQTVLSEKMVSDISESTYVSASQTLGVKDADKLVLPTPETVKPNFDLKSIVYTSAKEEISVSVEKGLKDNWFTRSFAGTGIGNGVGEAVADVITSENFHKLSKSKAVDEMVAAAEKSIKGKMPATFGNYESAFLAEFRANMNKQMGLDEKGVEIKGKTSAIPQIDYKDFTTDTPTNKTAMSNAIQDFQSGKKPALPENNLMIGSGGVPLLNGRQIGLT